jgi:hypothetical protein
MRSASPWRTTNLAVESDLHANLWK